MATPQSSDAERLLLGWFKYCRLLTFKLMQSSTLVIKTWWPDRILDGCGFHPHYCRAALTKHHSTLADDKEATNLASRMISLVALMGDG